MNIKAKFTIDKKKGIYEDVTIIQVTKSRGLMDDDPSIVHFITSDGRIRTDYADTIVVTDREYRRG